jgi:hypothetical protein
MAATQFAVVYGTASKVIRRIIEPGPENIDDSHIAVAQRNLAPGEALMALSLSDFPTSRRRADLRPHVGPPAHSGRCALIKDGIVVNVIHADPEIDAVHVAKTGHNLMQHDKAAIGWKHKGGALIP